MTNNTAILGIYEEEAQAAKAVDALRESGFRGTDISVLSSATPAGESSLVGAALEWLAEAGTVAIPGGPFVGTGPLMALLDNVRVGGNVEGLAAALIGAGTSEHHAKHYEGRIQSGHVLVSVHCESSTGLSAAREILERTGAENISSTAEASRPQIRRDVASEHEPDFRRNFAANHADLGSAYKDFAPFYEFGFRMARSERFAGKNFEDVELELKTAYLVDSPSTDWDRISSLVLYGWEQAGGSIRQGFALI